jgi:hypothetical protein
MANSNQVGIALWEESTFGTLPVTQVLKQIRFASDSLAKRTSSAISQEIRSDRQIADIVRMDIGAGGDLSGEFSYSGAVAVSSAQDLLIEAALQSADWSAVVTNTGTYSATAGVISASGGTNPETSIAVGDWVRLKDSAGTPQLQGYYLVTARDAVGHTITVTPSITHAVTEIERGSYIKNGTTDRSFSIERSHGDLASVFEQYAGMKVEGWSVSFASGAISSQSFNLVGKTETSASATMGDGANTAHATGEVMNGVDNVYAIRENHTSLGSVVRSVSFAVSNNLFPRGAIANLGPVSMGSGSCNVSGSLSIYFENNTLLDKYRNWTTTSLTLVLSDSAGNAYCIFLPSVKLSEASANAPGLNQDVIASFSFQAKRDSTYGEMIRITRWDA